MNAEFLKAVLPGSGADCMSVGMMMVVARPITVFHIGKNFIIAVVSWQGDDDLILKQFIA